MYKYVLSSLVSYTSWPLAAARLVSSSHACKAQAMPSFRPLAAARLVSSSRACQAQAMPSFRPLAAARLVSSSHACQAQAMPSFERSTPVSKGNAFAEIPEFTAWQPETASFTRYHVFINHRGRDVKATLASLIYRDLTYRRLKVFLDNKAMLQGDAIPLTIHMAIRTASVHVAIFSKHYAESAWCLRELCLMVESGAPIIPVFSEIRPSDLRMKDEGGPYIEAFRKHLSVQDPETVEKWRAALWRVSYHYGFRFEGDHGVLLEEISASVMKHINAKRRLEVSRMISFMFPNALKIMACYWRRFWRG